MLPQKVVLLQQPPCLCGKMMLGIDRNDMVMMSKGCPSLSRIKIRMTVRVPNESDLLKVLDGFLIVVPFYKYKYLTLPGLEDPGKGISLLGGIPDTLQPISPVLIGEEPKQGQILKRKNLKQQSQIGRTEAASLLREFILPSYLLGHK
jgi:hypothetical protein